MATTGPVGQISLFQILQGLNIDGDITVTHGNGAPVVSAPVGSVYLDDTNGIIYVYNATSGWLSVASESYVAAQIATLNSQLTWLAPVETVDTTLTAVPTGTAGDPITVDTVSITNGETVLFTALTTDPGVYTYDETTGIFTEVATPTAGDTTYVIATGQQFTYSESSGWVLSNLTTVDELSYIRAFIGKAASGSTTPDYTSTDVVVQGSNLVTSISALDASIGPESGDALVYTTADGALRANIAALDVALQTTASNASSGFETYTGTASGVNNVSSLAITEGVIKYVVLVADTNSSLYTSVEVLALVSNASVVYTVYGQLNNEAITGFQIGVVYDTTNDTAILQVTADVVVTVYFQAKSILVN